MAEIQPLRGLRYQPDRVDLGRVLAPPYDVIGTDLQAQLLARDPHNIVRVELGERRPSDREGDDRYSRARDTLDAWLESGVLAADPEPCLYVVDHEFRPDAGAARHRRSLVGTIAALPWDRAPILPHERTMRGPKEDRLALLRATGTQTSPVFGVWRGGAGMAEQMERVCAGPPAAGGRFQGDRDGEEVRLWVVSDPGSIAALQAALAPARLYIADGHHRYETAATIGGSCLIALSAADDPAVVLLPTHRLVAPGPLVPGSLGQVNAALGSGFALTPAQSWLGALRRMAEAREQRHAYAVLAPDGAGLLTRPRSGGISRDSLDVAVLEREVLEPWGLTAEAIRDGALSYEQDPRAMSAAVSSGAAALAVGVNGCTVAEMMAVADAGETMPQKSTYFYPKVPTGLVLCPVAGEE